MAQWYMYPGHQSGRQRLTWILELPSVTSAHHLGKRQPLCSQAIGRGCGRRIGVISLHTNRRWSKPCERHPACTSARHLPARACPRPESIAGGGKPTIQPEPRRQGRRTVRGSTSTPPTPRCSRVQRRGPRYCRPGSARTVASNRIQVMWSVAIVAGAGGALATWCAIAADAVSERQ